MALREAEAWTLFSEGERDDALAHLRSIAQYDATTHVYYADILPRPTGRDCWEIEDSGYRGQALRKHLQLQRPDSATSGRP